MEKGARQILKYNSVLGPVDKVETAIKRMQMFEPPDGYYLAFSGGKDSQCVYHLAVMAGVKFDAHLNITTVDPPELLQFIKEHYPDVEWNFKIGKDGKRSSMYKLIIENKMPPTRKARYCCAEFKECVGEGRLVMTGVRWAESIMRRDTHGLIDIKTENEKLKYNAIVDNEVAAINTRGGLIFMDDNDETKGVVESCYIRNRTMLNPIIDWTEEDVWDFLNNVAKVPHCQLYDEGYSRVGCVGCPLAGKEKMIRDFKRWPKYKMLYIHAFDKMLQNRIDSGDMELFEDGIRTGQQMLNRWIDVHGH